MCKRSRTPSSPLIASLSDAAVAEAIRMMQTNSGPKVLTLDPPISIENDNSSGIEISNFKLGISSEKIAGATFTLKNLSGAPVYAYAVSAELHWDTSEEGKPCRWGTFADGWFLNGSILQPGEEKQVQLNQSITPNVPSHLLKVVVKLDYAGFTNGTITGQSGVAYAAKLNENRRLQVEMQRKYLPLIQSGASISTFENQLKSEMSKEKDAKRKAALDRLQLALDGLGPQAFVQRMMEAPLVPID